MASKTHRRLRTMLAVGTVIGGVAAAATPAVASAATGPEGAKAAVACTYADVSASLRPVDAGAGQRYATLDFRTLNGKTCVLQNNLTGFQFLGKGAEGGAVSLPTDAVRDAGSSPSESLTLTPDTVGHLDVHYSVVGDPITPDSLLFVLPGDSATTALPWHQLIGDNGQIRVGHLHF